MAAPDLFGGGLSGFKLTFDDEFSSNDLNSSAGTLLTQYPWGPTKGGEPQYYEASSDIVSNDALTLEAQPNSNNPAGLPYTSGMVSTAGTFSQTYGYYEIRAQLPAGQGLDPAFWMLPTSGDWPPEIDVMEALGQNPYSYTGNTHNGTDGNDALMTQQSYASSTDLTAGYHTYGLDWEPDTITWYFDGTAIGSAPTPADLNVPMYLIANLGVTPADGFGGAPDATTPAPAYMNIDYIRAFSNSASATAVDLQSVSAADGDTSAAMADFSQYGAQAANEAPSPTPDPPPAPTSPDDPPIAPSPDPPPMPHVAWHFGAGHDPFMFSSAADQGNVITNFKLGADEFDLTGLLKSAGYHGNGKNTAVVVDPHGTGAGQHTVVALDDIAASSLEPGHGFIWHT